MGYGPYEFGSARDVERFFDSGMRRTTVFPKELLEIKLSSLISSCPTTSSMVLHHTLVVLVLLGQIVLRPPVRLFQTDLVNHGKGFG